MRIGIIGTGNMARGFARGLSVKHDVILGSRDPAGARAVAEETGAAGVGTYEEAARDADVVFLTVPWTAAIHVVEALPALAGKILVDVTNPYIDGELRPLEGSSTAEEVQKRTSARVVKGWNTVLSKTLQDPSYGGIAPTVFLAGNDEIAKATVAELARDLGFVPEDVGSVDETRMLERLQGLIGGLVWPEGAIRILHR